MFQHKHFQGYYSLPFRFSALPSFCSQRCCPRRTIVDFLSQCRTMTTPHTTNSGTKFVAFQPVRCRVWHSKNLLYQYTLRFMASTNEWFMCNRSYSCTSLDHDLRTTWARDFVRLHASLRECLKQTDRLYHCKKGIVITTVISDSNEWAKVEENYMNIFSSFSAKFPPH